LLLLLSLQVLPPEHFDLERLPNDCLVLMR